MLMMSIKKKYDSNHASLFNNFSAVIFVSTPTKITMLMLLKGIKTAAIIGDNMLLAAKPTPTRLYKIERIKLAVIIFLLNLLYFKN